VQPPGDVPVGAVPEVG